MENKHLFCSEIQGSVILTSQKDLLISPMAYTSNKTLDNLTSYLKYYQLLFTILSALYLCKAVFSGLFNILFKIM